MQPCPACKDSGRPGYYYATDEPLEGDGWRTCTICGGTCQVDYQRHSAAHTAATREGAKRYWAEHDHKRNPPDAKQLAVLEDVSILPEEAARRLAKMGRKMKPASVSQWRWRHGMRKVPEVGKP